MAKTDDRAAPRAGSTTSTTAYFSGFANRDTVRRGVRGLHLAPTSSTFAARITVPTLLIGADEDPITTVAAQRAPA